MECLAAAAPRAAELGADGGAPVGVGEYGVAGLLGEAVPALAPGGLMVAGGTATTGIDGGGDFTVGSLDLASSTFGTGLGDGDGVGV